MASYSSSVMRISYTRMRRGNRTPSSSFPRQYRLRTILGVSTRCMSDPLPFVFRTAPCRLGSTGPLTGTPGTPGEGVRLTRLRFQTKGFQPSQRQTQFPLPHVTPVVLPATLQLPPQLPRHHLFYPYRVANKEAVRLQI